MTRWFYSDPLAAAWMAKRHGMRFLHKATVNECDILALFAAGVFRFQSIPLDVHPDSLHLLEPRAGDLWQETTQAGVVTAGVVISTSGGVITVRVPERRNGKSHFCCAPAIGRIIQRDGKPFFWPEREP